MSKHTLTPWTLHEFSDRWAIRDSLTHSEIAEVIRLSSDEMNNEQANAAHIVLAVNMHDDLIEFIESLTLANGKYPYLDGKSIVADARAILAKKKDQP